MEKQLRNNLLLTLFKRSASPLNLAAISRSFVTSSVSAIFKALLLLCLLPDTALFEGAKKASLLVARRRVAAKRNFILYVFV